MTKQLKKTKMATLARALKRIGCALALVCWFAFLLLPCALFALARDGQIVFSRSGLPGDVLLRVQLLTDADYTGLSFTTSSVSRSEDGARACVRSTVRYLFWRGESASVARYCECYARTGSNAPWLLSPDAPATSCQPGE